MKQILKDCIFISGIVFFGILAISLDIFLLCVPYIFRSHIPGFEFWGWLVVIPAFAFFYSIEMALLAKYTGKNV